MRHIIFARRISSTQYARGLHSVTLQCGRSIYFYWDSQFNNLVTIGLGWEGILLGPPLIYTGCLIK